ncbi:MAG TPA: hypothetical protein VFK61_00570 [Candidatus Limnocylindria bacterium]|jgi:hypothetical protein|nr:hypothetical protein [Candidatus Limnocylindria bacterium]
MDDAAIAAQRRAFDFWLGEWEVRGPAGRLLGHNRITALFDGAAIREEWTGAGGVQGTSLNCYSAATDRWHQTWVDADGDLLLLDGGPQDGGMVMEGVTGSTRHRISWTPLPEGDGLRQHWETREEDGDWQTAFDGRYSRVR